MKPVMRLFLLGAFAVGLFLPLKLAALRACSDCYPPESLPGSTVCSWMCGGKYCQSTCFIWVELGCPGPCGPCCTNQAANAGSADASSPTLDRQPALCLQKADGSPFGRSEAEAAICAKAQCTGNGGLGLEVAVVPGAH